MTTRPLIRRCTSLGLPFFKQCGYIKNYPRTITTFNQICFINKKFCQSRINPNYFYYTSVKYLSNQDDKPLEPPPKKLGLVQRFKKMYRDYWYVLVPVHLVTSIGWLTGFYYLAKSGIDIAALLENMGISERFTSHFKDSSMGYIAVTYGLYKIATPIRYTLTLGGTTLSINYLKLYGYIKPVPSKEKVKEIIQEQKEKCKNTFRETKEELRQRKNQLKERKDNIISDYTHFKKELKDIKTNSGKLQFILNKVKRKKEKV